MGLNGSVGPGGTEKPQSIANGEQACLGCLRTLACTDRLELIESGSVTGFPKALLLNTGFYTLKGNSSVRSIYGEGAQQEWKRMERSMNRNDKIL